MLKNKFKQTDKSESIRGLNNNEIFVLEHHGLFDGEYYQIRRRFQLSCFKVMNGLNTDFDDIGAVWFLVDFINKFITEEALDFTKTTNDQALQFFAYAYKEYQKDEVSNISQPKVEKWVWKMIEFNPRFFTDKHLEHGYKYEIYSLFKKMNENGLCVEYEEV